MLARRAVAQRPNEANYHDTLGFILTRMKKLTEARDEITRSVELSAPDSIMRARALFSLARLAQALNETGPIAKYLDEALAIDARQGVFTAQERKEVQALRAGGAGTP